MDLFFIACKDKYRWQTSKGNIGVEDLFSFPVGNEKADFGNQQTLDSLATVLDEQYKKSGSRSFLTKNTPKNRVLKNKRDIILAIMEYKMEMQERASKGLETKKHNAKIDELIARKKERELEEMSIEDLEALRK